MRALRRFTALFTQLLVIQAAILSGVAPCPMQGHAVGATSAEHALEMPAPHSPAGHPQTPHHHGRHDGGSHCAQPCMPGACAAGSHCSPASVRDDSPLGLKAVTLKQVSTAQDETPASVDRTPEPPPPRA